MTTSTATTSTTSTDPSGAPAAELSASVDDLAVATAAWAGWRAARDESLTGEHGWLTLTALHHLPASPGTLAALPGQWWADADGAHVLASAGDGLRAADTRNGVEAGPDDLDGLHTVVVPEAGTTTAGLVDVGSGTQVSIAVEVALRTGGYIARVRDPRAPARTDFTGVPTYAYDPAWVLDVPVRWYDEPRPAVVGAAQPGLEHHVSVLGELDLTVDGRTATLAITGATRAGATVLFSDASEDTAGWRIVSLDVSATAAAADAGDTPRSVETSTLRLDLNRTINLPYAFSDYGTCPRPVDSNAVPFAVTAGERAPR